MTEPLYYPEFPCHMAPLRPCDPAPKPGCRCEVCSHLRQDTVEYVPRVISRTPFHGVLERRSLGAA